MEEEKILNCTSNDIYIFDPSEKNIIAYFPCSGYNVQCIQKPQKNLGTIKYNGSFISISYPPIHEEIINLPPHMNDSKMHIIVPENVAEKLREISTWRGSVYCIDGDQVVRNGQGQIIGTKSLIQYHNYEHYEKKIVYYYR